MGRGRKNRPLRIYILQSPTSIYKGLFCNCCGQLQGQFCQSSLVEDHWAVLNLLVHERIDNIGLVGILKYLDNAYTVGSYTFASGC